MKFNVFCGHCGRLMHPYGDHIYVGGPIAAEKLRCENLRCAKSIIIIEWRMTWTERLLQWMNGLKKSARKYAPIMGMRPCAELSYQSDVELGVC